MYNWHLLLFLIHSLLQPIFSQHIQIDGGRHCTHSSRSSLPDERLTLREKYRLASEDPDLSDYTEFRRHSHRNEPTPTTFLGDRLLERRTLPPDERNRRYKNKKLHRLVNDRRDNIQNLDGPTFTYENARRKETSLQDRLAYEHNQRRSRFVRNHHEDLTRIFENDVAHGDLRDHNDIRQIQDRHIICSKDSSFRNDHSDIGEHARNNNNDDVCNKRSIYQNDWTMGGRREVRNYRGHTSLNAWRAVDSLDVHKRIARNTRTESSGFRNSRRYSRSPEWRTRNENVRRITDKEMNNRDEENKNVRNQRPTIKNYDRSHLRDYTRERSTFTLERKMGPENAERITNRHFNNERNSRDTRYRSLSLERGLTRINVRKITRRRLAHNVQLRARNTRDESTNIRNYEKYSRDSLDRRLSLDREIRQENTRRITETQRASHTGDENANIRNKARQNSNYERYSRETRDRTMSLERDVHDENRRITKRNYVLQHEDENNNIRNKLRMFSLGREIRKDSTRRIMDIYSITRHTEEVKGVRNGPLNIRNSERYSKDTRDRKLSLDREERMRITERQKITYHDKYNKNLEREPAYIRNRERFSRDVRDRTLSIARIVRNEDTRRVTEGQDATLGTVEMKMVRNEPLNIRSYERYSVDTRDRTLLLDRKVRQENNRRLTDSHYVSRNEQERKNMRNRPTNIRNTERFLRSNRDGTLSLERVYQANTRFTERYDARDEEDRKNVRNEPISINNYERFSRDNRDTALSLEREVRKENMRRFTERQDFPHRVQELKNIRNEPNNIRRVETHLQENSDRPLSLERTVRKETTRRFTERQDVSHRVEDIRNVRNEPINIRSYDRHSRDNRDRTLSLDPAVRVENTRRIIKKYYGSYSEEENKNIRNMQANIRNRERFLRDRTLTLERRVSQDKRRITDNRSTPRTEEGYKNIRNERLNLRHKERSSQNIRDRTLSLESGVPRENEYVLNPLPNTRNMRDVRHLRETRDRTLSLDRIRNINEFYNDGNYERYSLKVRGREKSSLSFARNGPNVDLRTITNNVRWTMERQRNERTTNEYERNNIRDHISGRIVTLRRNNQQDIRRIIVNSDSHRLIRSTWEKDGPTDTRKSDRSRINNRNVRQKNENKLVNGQIYPNTHLNDNTNVRAISAIRDVREKYITRSVENRKVSVIYGQDKSTENMYRHYYLRTINGENRVNRVLHNGYLREDTRMLTSTDGQLRKLDRKTSAERVERYDINKRNENRIHNYSERLNMRDALKKRSRPYPGNDRLVKNVKSDLYQRNTFAHRTPDKDFGIVSQRNMETHIILSSKIQKDSITTTISCWQYLFYALQGIYIIGVFIQGNAKTRSLGWLPCGRLLKVG